MYRSANWQTDIAPVSQTEAATLLNVSPRAVAAELANMRLGDNQHVGSANLQTLVSQTEAATQRSAVAVELANLKHGGDRKNQDANLQLDNNVTQAEAATLKRQCGRGIRSSGSSNFGIGLRLAVSRASPLVARAFI
jgi:hypothetical protein